MGVIVCEYISEGKHIVHMNKETMCVCVCARQREEVCVFHSGTCDRIAPCVLFVSCTCLSASGLPLLGQQAWMTCSSSAAIRRGSSTDGPGYDRETHSH